MDKLNKLFLILILFMAVLCIGAVSASEDVTDDAVAVSDDVTVDEVVSEVDSGDGSIATEDDESLESVDDSGNESLAVQDVEQVDDVDNTTLTAENENESDVNDTNSTLTAEVDDELSGQSREYLNPTDTLSTNTFSTGNTIYYLNEGVYSAPQIRFGGSKTKSVNNFTIRPNGTANVIINIIKDNNNKYGLNFGFGSNIVIENIKFTTSIKDGKELITVVKAVQNMTFRNCTFELSTTHDSIDKPNLLVIRSANGDNQIDNIHFENCIFSNCNAITNILYVEGPVTNSIYMSNCIFENNTVGNYVLDLVGSAKIIFNNNTFDINNSISITNSNYFDSDVSFNVRNNKNLTNNTQNDIFIELLDENNNHIYSSALKFIVDGGEPVAPTSFDKTTGLYKLTYTPTKTGKIPVSIQCSNVVLGEVTPVDILVVASPELTINGTDSITYGDTAIYVNASLKEDINGENVTFSILKGSTVIDSVNATVNNGFANATFNQKLNAGSYTLSVNYMGNNNYGAASDSKSLTVSKATPNINITVDSVSIGEPVVVVITVLEDVTGEIESIGIGSNEGNTKYFAPKHNIIINSTIMTLVFEGNNAPANNYGIWYNYNGNGNYNKREIYWFEYSSANTPKFSIFKLDSCPSIDVDDIGLGDNASISVSGLSENATGTITYYVDDDATGIPLNVGETYNATGLSAGPHTVRIVYSGDANYSGNETTTTFNVHTITLKENVFELGSVVVSALVPEGCEGSVQLIGAGEPVSVDIINGVATFDLSTLTLGTHTLTLLYNGKYNINATAAITVNPIVSPLDELTTGENTVGIKLPEGATGNLTIIIDDNEPIIVPVTDGSASYPINDLSAGSHKITMSYTDGTYSFTTGTQEITVAKTTPVAAPEVPAVVNAGSAVSIPLAFAKDATGIVLYDIDGKKLYVELVNGTADLDLGVLSAGEKVVTYKYLGDDKYAATAGNVTFNVTKIDTAISADKVTANYATAKNLVVTLKDKNGQVLVGKSVTVKVGTISKTLNTNKNGQISVDVSALAPNTYTATFTFAGDDVYTAAAGSVSVKVNKGASKITAAKKAFKVKQTKKYTVTLKSGKKAISKVKVTLKIGKKTYFAKTNAKGQATFNLKLAKGTFKPVVKFAANKYYKGTTAKTTIIVK